MGWDGMGWEAGKVSVTVVWMQMLLLRKSFCGVDVDRRNKRKNKGNPTGSRGKIKLISFCLRETVTTTTRLTG